MLYPVAIERGDDKHAWGVVVPDLPGCFSAGDSLDGAMVNVKEAIALWMEDRYEDGLDIPPGGALEEHQLNDDFEGWIWAVVEIDTTPYLGKSHKINVTLPDILIQQIDRVVATQEKFKSRSNYLAQAAQMMLSK